MKVHLILKKGPISISSGFQTIPSSVSEVRSLLSSQKLLYAEVLHFHCFPTFMLLLLPLEEEKKIVAEHLSDGKAFSPLSASGRTISTSRVNCFSPILLVIYWFHVGIARSTLSNTLKARWWLPVDVKACQLFFA